MTGKEVRKGKEEVLEIEKVLEKVEGSKKMNRYVALYVETTGFSPQNGDRVIEIGAVAIENQSIIAEFSSLIDVKKRSLHCNW